MTQLRARLPSNVIPQADNPRILVGAWALVARGEPCDADSLGIHPRQVTYYRAALRILGLSDEDLVPPPLGADKRIAEDAIAHLKVRFEDSECGRAWIEWSSVTRIEEVDPQTAMAFLSARSDLSGTTLERRATTLSRWHAWMTRVEPLLEIAPLLDEKDDDDKDSNAATTLTAPYGHYMPRTSETGKNWRQWSYNQWNERLVDRYLLVGDAATADHPVDRIPATPEELALIAGADPSEAAAVAQAFVQRIVDQLPMGKKSFCGFCTEYESWSPHCPEPPHFFAMLWLTCLVAYGYPRGEGAFFPRFREILGKFDNFQSAGKACLPRLWEDTAAWTRARRQVGDAVRELDLPPPSEHRAVIGYSHFLAFPNRLDRNCLARILWDAGLVGFEPPLKPILVALAARRNQFSSDFVQDLDGFLKRYADGEDPRNSAFWRAIRQEALDPSVNPTAPTGQRAPRTALLFLADDEGLRPVIGCNLDQPLPIGFEARPFEEPIEWAGYVTGAGGDLEVAWRDAFGDGRLLPVGARKLIAQGVLILREFASCQYEVVSGPDIHGCQMALVTSSLAPGFITVFGGGLTRARTQPSLVQGWVEIHGCEVQQLDESPAGLEGATQLLRTMNPPSVALVGGVRTANGFLFVPGFLPIVRAPGARSLEVFSHDRPAHPCTPSTADHNEWYLPRAVDGPGAYTLRAHWSIFAQPEAAERIGETEFHLIAYSIDDDYRPKPSGHHLVESCLAPEVDVAGYADVPFGISTSQPSASADLLDLDASARFLGPGLGEMSFTPAPGFDWLVVGPKKNPELLVFVGDSSNPTPPAARRSTSKGDLRHWRSGFNAKQCVVRDADGHLTSLIDAPSAVSEVLVKYQRHHVVDGGACAATRLETRIEATAPRVAPDPKTSQAADVLAALCSRRSGLRYAEVREVFQVLLGTDDPIVMQQILRGWTEAGIIDVLRGARVSRLTLVPRRPRFVMVRRGPAVEATLVGLLTSVRRRRVEAAVEQLERSFVRPLLPANQWQPSTLRLRCSEEIVESVRRTAELGPSEWLDWPSRDVPPRCLDLRAARAQIVRTAPPDSYHFDAGWDWSMATFLRGHRSVQPTRLERRMHVDSSAIYVLTRDDQPLLWTHSRTWALLEAYAARGVPPFKHAFGVLTNTGRAPVHLPLLVGRLCLLIGEALPGPTIGSKVLNYIYPFGPQLFNLVERVLPAEWFEQSGQPTWSHHARSPR